MTFPREQLLEAFREDLREYLGGMRTVLTKLDGSRDAVTGAELDEVYRQAHGLHAAARACDFTTVEQIGKRLEQFFAGMRKGTLRPNLSAFAAVRGVLDALEGWSLALSENPAPGEPTHAVGALDPFLEPKAASKPTGAKAASPPAEKDDLVTKLRAAFQTEHKEHLEGMRAILATVPRDGFPKAQIDEVFRRAHSLKGAARIAEVAPVEAIAHRLETLFAKAREGGLELNADVVRAVHQGLDAIEDAASAAAGGRESPPPTQALEAISRVLNAELGVRGGEQKANQKEAEQPAPIPHSAPRAQPPTEIPHSEETLRVSADHLDRLLRSAGEFQTEALHLGQVGRELNDLGRQIDALAKECDAIRATAPASFRRLAEAPEFAPVARYLATVERQVRSLVASSRGVRRRHRQGAWALQQLGARLQQDVRGVRMVSADSVFQGFHKMVRDLARDEGKEVEFRAVGLETLGDRAVLQALKDPIMHLLSNAVAHGIEPPAERASRGKPEAARVTLRLDIAGAKLRVSVEDDGRGINPKAVADTAVRRELLTPAEAAAMPVGELTRLVFRPGFTTAPKVTGVSGRGMGLSVVHEAVARLQGEVELLPADGPGTRFVVSVPLSIATQRVLLVGCQGQTYAVPLSAVERLVRVAPQEIETIEGKPALVLNGRSVPVLSLASLIGVGGDKPSADAPVLLAVLRAGGRRAAVIVDDFLAQRDTLVKPLDGPAARVATFAGGVLLEDGAVALVLNPTVMLTNTNGNPPPLAPAGAKMVAKAVAPAKPSQRQTVLVVDDSLTTRTLEKSILEVHGYTVRIAVDGLEALAKLRAELVDLVITDVEMPRMNGFQLIEEMKKDPRFAKLPVIVVTSLAKREDQERGLALGADAYIVKQKFDHQNLLDTIRQIL